MAPSGKPLRLLVIDDDPASVDLIESALSQLDVDIRIADNPELGLRLFEQHRPRVVLTDLMMPGLTGMDVLERVLAIDPGTEVLLITAHNSSEAAVEAIQKGAADYLIKPLNLDALRNRIDEYVREARRRSRVTDLDSELLGALQFENIVGRSPAILEVFRTIRHVAPHFRSVLITGPTGTGKELAAKALHRLSPVAEKPFAVCNCSALAETLIESELFGYVRGAFTGAQQDKVGLFEYANGGTVFLDEIGDMPLAAQAKLLRVLQNQEVQRVGSPAVRKVNLRVIAATHRDLRSMVQKQTFREDLYYRLSMVEVSLPPLRERKEDLPLLQRYFVDKFARQYGKPILGITRRTQVRMARYVWPGNIRELENVIGNACMMTQSDVLDLDDFPAGLLRDAAPNSPALESGLVSLEVVQQRHVRYVLEQVGGDKTRAAEILGISRGTLYNMLAKPDAPP
jgi:DNA-binding NtrC family response regulator